MLHDHQRKKYGKNFVQKEVSKNIQFSLPQLPLFTPTTFPRLGKFIMCNNTIQVGENIFHELIKSPSTRKGSQRFWLHICDHHCVHRLKSKISNCNQCEDKHVHNSTTKVRSYTIIIMLKSQWWSWPCSWNLCVPSLRDILYYIWQSKQAIAADRKTIASTTKVNFCIISLWKVFLTVRDVYIN